MDTSPEEVIGRRLRGTLSIFLEHLSQRTVGQYLGTELHEMAIQPAVEISHVLSRCRDRCRLIEYQGDCRGDSGERRPGSSGNRTAFEQQPATHQTDRRHNLVTHVLPHLDGRRQRSSGQWTQYAPCRSQHRRPVQAALWAARHGWERPSGVNGDGQT